LFYLRRKRFASTSAFFKDAMAENVVRVEKELREATLNGRRGYELEEAEAKERNTGKNQANH